MARIEAAISRTSTVFAEIPTLLQNVQTERELQALVHHKVDACSADTAWERQYCPIVNFGPDSPVGHVAPGEILLTPGQVIHLDFGVRLDDYCADLQRCWYVARPGETAPPDVVSQAVTAAAAAITAAADVLKPGCIGADVDAVARQVVTAAGYLEYKHALGH